MLKGAETGGSIAASYGMYSAGDGEQYQLTGDTGFKLGDRGFIHFAAQGGHQDQTDRARPYLGTVTATSAPAGKVVQRLGDPDVDNYSVSYNGEYKVADYLTAYSYGIYTKRDVLSNGFFRPAGDARNIPSIYPDGFLPQIYNESEDIGFVGGFKTYTAGGTNIDFSYTHGSNKLTFDIKHTLNRSMGPTSPTEFYAGALEIKQDVLNFDFDKQLDWGLAYPVTLSYGAEWRGEKFTQSPGEPGSYINGGVLRPNGSPTASGAQVFPGFRPGDSGSFDRNNLSFYAGLEGDLTDKFSLGLAARYEDYSDFGDTTTGKVTARYAFTDKVALRGTVSTGFHAPSLQQQYYQTTSTNFIGGIPFDIATFRTDNAAAVALGAEPLKAEKSTNYSLGLVLQPVEALYLTIDAYQIKVKDRITLSENLGTSKYPGTNIDNLLIKNYLNANGFPDVAGGRYFTNAIDTTTQGVDVVGTYTFNFAGGSALDLTTGYNYNKTKIDKVAANPASLTAIDPYAVRFGRVELARFEVGAPRDKFFLGGTWKTGAFSFNATATRYGEFTVRNASPALDQTFDPKWTLDLAATYKLNGWEFTVGGDNVLNEYPDEVLYDNSTSGQLPYSSTSPFGFNGAYAYAKIGYKW